MKVKLETTELNEDNIKRALQVLIDNGIEKDEADTVLEAIGYVMLDTDLDEILSKVGTDINLWGLN